MATFRLLLALALLVAPGAWAARKADDGRAGRDATARPIRVLFVGNSYTYVNDLPSIVAAVASARGVNVAPGMLAEPDFALEDHIVTGAYDAEIASLPWDWVVLQQGPSSLPENRANLRTWSLRAASSAYANRTAVLMFAAWPAQANIATSLAAEQSYREAADATHGCAAPVATAWRFARESRPDLALYQDDRLHPRPVGTLLTALVIVRAMFPNVPMTGAPMLDPVLVSEGAGWSQAYHEAAALDAIAARAVEAEPARCAFAK
jgi:hypothetical protein